MKTCKEQINCPVLYQLICLVLYGIRGRFQMKRTEWLQETRKMRFEDGVGVGVGVVPF